MGKTAEDTSTTLNLDSDLRREEMSVDGSDEIAKLLAGDDSEEEDEKGDESQTNLSNLDDEKSDEKGDAVKDEKSDIKDDESDDEDGDATWEKTLGLSEGDLNFDEEGNVTGFNVKVNGESEVISAKDLLAGFQNNKANTQKSQTHAESVKAFAVQKEQIQQVYASKLQSVDALVKHFEKQLISEYDSIDWAKLRESDPAEYAASRSDFMGKATEIQRIQEAINKDFESQDKEKQQENTDTQKVYMKQQFDLMIEKNPEWSDEKVRNTAKGEFKTFVIDNYGFTDQEFDTVFDARLIELIKDAKRFHDAAKVSDKKRQKPVPKFQKSVGSRKKGATSKLDKLTAASKKAHGPEKRDLQQSAVAELLIGG